MIEISKGAGVVVAGDVQATMAAFDGAVLSGARMYASVIEAMNGAGIPASQTQKLLRSISSGISAVVDGRGEIVSALRQMTAIKGHSNLRVEDYGCPDGWDVVAPNAQRGAAPVDEAA